MYWNQGKEGKVVENSIFNWTISPSLPAYAGPWRGLSSPSTGTTSSSLPSSRRWRGGSRRCRRYFPEETEGSVFYLSFAHWFSYKPVNLSELRSSPCRRLHIFPDPWGLCKTADCSSRERKRGQPWPSSPSWKVEIIRYYNFVCLPKSQSSHSWRTSWESENFAGRRLKRC